MKKPSQLPNLKRKDGVEEKSPETLAIAIYSHDERPPTPPSPPPPGWWKRNRDSLLVTLIVGLILLAIPTIIKFIYVYYKEGNIRTRLWRTQDDIQKMDELINRVLANNQRALWNGQKKYMYPGTDNLLGKDSWANGKLIMRSFFRSGCDSLIARDDFKYDKDTIMGKDRVFMDDYNRRFLKDYYLQDGTLIKKHYFPDGQTNYVEYHRDFQSPLPPPGIIFYR